MNQEKVNTILTLGLYLLSIHLAQVPQDYCLASLRTLAAPRWAKLLLFRSKIIIFSMVSLEKDR